MIYKKKSSQVGSKNKIFSHKMTLITFYVRNKKHLRERNNQKHTAHNKNNIVAWESHEIFFLSFNI